MNANSTARAAYAESSVLPATLEPLVVVLGDGRMARATAGAA